jgi:proteasome lid subunit RPN8/RPN11
MTLELDPQLLEFIRRHGEINYPAEGAGLLLGRVEGELRHAFQAWPQVNRAPAEEALHRYRIDPRDMLAAEEAAENGGLEVVGVFHSHPDHPPVPSTFDRDWALPWYSYLITAVVHGRAEKTSCWRLAEDRTGLREEALQVRPIAEKED